MPVFSGNDSKELWKRINRLSKKRGRKKTARAVAEAMYLLGCKCQELESVVERLKAEMASLHRNGDDNGRS